MSSSSGRRGSTNRKDSDKKDQDFIKLLSELQSAGDGGFQGKLDEQFAQTAKAMSVYQQEVKTIVQGHVEILRKVLSEAGRLHMENSQLRKQCGGGGSLGGYVPKPAPPPEVVDAEKSTERKSLFDDFEEDIDNGAPAPSDRRDGDMARVQTPVENIGDGLLILPEAPLTDVVFSTPAGLWSAHDAPPPPLPMPEDDEFEADALMPDGAAPKLDIPGSICHDEHSDIGTGSSSVAVVATGSLALRLPGSSTTGPQFQCGGLSVPRGSGMQAPPGAVRISTNSVQMSATPSLMCNQGSVRNSRNSSSSSRQRKNSVDSNMSGGSNGLIFEVLPVWRKSRKSRMNMRATVSALHGGGHPLRPAPSLKDSEEDLDVDEEEEEERKPGLCERKFMIHPNASPRACWDVASLLLVSYDTITIPMSFFDIPENPFSLFMQWTTRLMWSVDLLLTFFTGYLKRDGNAELRPSRVLWRYLTTWLLLDFVVVGIDWFEVVISSMGAAAFARIGKTGRIVRILRLIRLMRLVRMRQVLQMLTERIMSEVLVVMADIGKSMTVILGMSHISACCWYGIGVQDKPNTWVNTMHRGFRQQSVGYRYAASVHWSLSQFSGGMDEIAPQNPQERLFAISMFLLAFIVAAIFVSSLTSSMTRLLILGNQQNQQVFNLRRYLYQNHISNELSLRIQRNATYAMAEQQKYMPEGAIELLAHVSEPLRMELHFELYAPVIKVHPFFKRYIDECPQVVRKICHRAVRLVQVSDEDVIFTVGEIPTRPKVYFPMNGDMEYVAMDGEVTKCSELEEKHISEATLWTRWMHRGALQALCDCRLAIVDSTTFQEIVTEFEHPGFSPKLYAFEFVEMLNETGIEQISDLPMKSEPEVERLSTLKDVQVSDVGNVFQLVSRVASTGRVDRSSVKRDRWSGASAKKG